VIKVRLEYSREILTKIENDLETFEVIAYALFNQSFNKVRQPLLAALRKTPKRRYWEGKDFANPASRRAFFAKTKGKAYTRTGRYAAGWNVSIKKTDEGGQLIITNTTNYGKFVGGSFARTGKNFQQRGHIRTGWPKSQDTTDKYLLEAQIDFEQRIDKYINTEFGRVSTTTRNR
jgi:hypothetical protein